MARPAASTRAKSILATPEDFKMAQTQLHRDELEGVEAEEQDEWARKMIATIPNACPDKMAFERHDTLPLYMCAKGGHAVTDELLAEGLGGLMAAPKGRAPPGGFPFEEFEGPFYLDEESEFYVTDCKKWWARKNKERENNLVNEEHQRCQKFVCIPISIAVPEDVETYGAGAVGNLI
ncbi:hypothetical protein M7I_2865 [Glarea lozoyensis 74030]|uniref:Uncharacterized protein n=1 Tax=Glarea lozoyensis (strain ATCC 74030 / MF5533) TaxID=1104152 RepID=H0EJY1_GLAL7|nr:hypothetical protein M7I_2865 [Glarea lozoyensis 74030]